MTNLSIFNTSCLQMQTSIMLEPTNLGLKTEQIKNINLQETNNNIYFTKRVILLLNS